MIYTDRQGRAFIVDGDQLRLISPCCETELCAVEYGLACQDCLTLAPYDDDRPDATMADVRDQTRYAEQEASRND